MEDKHVEKARRDGIPSENGFRGNAPRGVGASYQGGKQSPAYRAEVSGPTTSVF